ncbi:uncharacterized protein LOC141751110 [Larus michahellis]|uniref:uncharacterized protein LOC141751110 n=1 Tax=Larus michahellis TaxID=119627 RepID=UPI003D9B1ED3
MKEAQSHLEEELRAMQEALGLGKLQDAASQLPGLHHKKCHGEVWPRVVLDPALRQEKSLKEMRSLSPVPAEEGSGSLSSPTESPQADVDTQHGASFMPGMEEPWAQPVPSTSNGAAGTQPGSEEMQAGTHRAPVSPEKAAGAPSDGKSIYEASATTPRMQPGSPGAQSTTPGMQPGSPSAQITTPGMQPAFPGIKTTTKEEQPGSPGTWTASPGAQLGSSGMSRLQEPAMPWGSSASSGASGHGMKTVEALRQSGQLGHPKEQVVHLEATKSDHAEHEQTHLLFPEGDDNGIAFRGQVSSQQSLASELQEVKEKIRQLEDALGKLWVAGADWRADGSDQIALQLGSMLQEIKREVLELKDLGLQELKQEVLELKDLGLQELKQEVLELKELELQKIKRELKELGEHQDMTKATLKQLVTEVAEQMQAQQDKLKVMENAGQEQAEAQAARPACCGDTGAQVGQLLQRYEKLQEVVDSLMSRQAVGKVVRQLPRQSQQEEREVCRCKGATKSSAPSWGTSCVTVSGSSKIPRLCSSPWRSW